MRTRNRSGHWLLALMLLLIASSAVGQDDPPRTSPPSTETHEQPAQEQKPPSAAELAEDDRKMLDYLLVESRRMLDTIEALRAELANARLEAMVFKRELNELRTFMADHAQLGRDFEEYQNIKAIKEREAKQRQQREAREQFEARQAQRRAESALVRASREAAAAESRRDREYRKAGFNPLGLDVYVSQTSFFYDSTGENTVPWRIDYDPFLGHYAKFYPWRSADQVDFSEMTISGSVLNASAEVRNLGVAFTFFDANGTQVGHEIVQVNNARPDVPYPFTTTLEMALNRAFHSASVYVLYADPIVTDDSGD